MDQLQVWGTELHKKMKWLFPLIPESVKSLSLPFYGGEMLVFAKKS
jgi:hypothetical protein